MPSVVRTGIEIALILLLLLPVQVSRADVTITQLANDGVILSDGASARVMIDGMVTEPYSLYGGLPKEAADLFFKAAGPFAGIQLALVSHQHPEHNQPGAACRFLQTSSGTFFVSSTQVVDLMREKCRQFIITSARIRTIDPQVDRPEILTVQGARITVFPLSHGVGNYAALQNFAHLVEIGGLRVLDVGDAAMDPTDFQRAGVAGMNVDVALIPFWYFQPGPGGDILRQFLDVPHQIAVHIPPGEMAEVRQYLQAEFPQVVVMDQALQQVQFSPADPPPP
jgi:L-ascorbate metabolism protein UlaG (beta-lactamase superfamily)